MKKLIIGFILIGALASQAQNNSTVDAKNWLRDGAVNTLLVLLGANSNNLANSNFRGVSLSQTPLSEELFLSILSSNPENESSQVFRLRLLSQSRELSTKIANFRKANNIQAYQIHHRKLLELESILLEIMEVHYLLDRISKSPNLKDVHIRTLQNLGFSIQAVYGHALDKLDLFLEDAKAIQGIESQKVDFQNLITKILVNFKTVSHQGLLTNDYKSLNFDELSVVLMRQYSNTYTWSSAAYLRPISCRAYFSN